MKIHKCGICGIHGAFGMDRVRPLSPPHTHTHSDKNELAAQQGRATMLPLILRIPLTALGSSKKCGGNIPSLFPVMGALWFPLPQAHHSCRQQTCDSGLMPARVDGARIRNSIESFFRFSKIDNIYFNGVLMLLVALQLFHASKNVFF